MERATDHERLITIAMRQERYERDLGELEKRVGTMEDGRVNEAINCPFWPTKAQNGNTIVGRVDVMERREVEHRAEHQTDRFRLYAVFAFIVFTNLATVAKDWWPVVSKLVGP